MFSTEHVEYQTTKKTVEDLKTNTIVFFCLSHFLLYFCQQVTKLAGNPLANLAALGLGGLTGSSGGGSMNASGIYSSNYREK